MRRMVVIGLVAHTLLSAGGLSAGVSMPSALPVITGAPTPPFALVVTGVSAVLAAIAPSAIPSTEPAATTPSVSAATPLATLLAADTQEMIVF
ncbi:MAG: hypothetical protein HGA19_05305 [Oscillochloris sp.]|nr:hypothetical protein [Oscillochloris sp.]